MTSLVLLLIALLTRRPLAQSIASASCPEPIFWVRDVACILLASILSCLAIETWNDGMSQVAFMYAELEFVMIFVVMVACYLLSFRGGILMALASVAATVMGVAQHYVSEFRGTPVLPTDLSPSSLATAGEVADGYDLVPDDIILMTIAFGILAVAASLLVRRPKGDGYALHAVNTVKGVIGAFSRPKGEDAPVGDAAGDGGTEDDKIEVKDDPPDETASDGAPGKAGDDDMGDIPPDEPAGDDSGPKAPSHMARGRLGVMRHGMPGLRRSRPGRHARAVPEEGASERRCPRLRRRAGSVLSPILTALVAYAIISGGGFLATLDYKEEFPDMITDWWAITRSYQKQGTLPTFAMLAQTSVAKEPDGWTEKKAQAELDALVRRYRGTGKAAPEGDERPDIIGIMNESFCDMTVYDRLELPIDAAPRFMRTDAPEGIIDSGRMRISVFGGSTADSEFEFLTGGSMLGLGLGVVPFASYNLSNAPSIVRQLSDLGYGTYAIHPCDERNWDRMSRYPELGFDEFISEDDFEDAGLDDKFHDAISDTMCYEMVKQVLDKREGTGEPTFIWNVTMQNHGGYDKRDIPEDQLVDYDLSMLSDGCAEDLREYMSGIANSTEATLRLLEDLEGRERPTMVVFYGDHQPVCNDPVIDEIFSDIDGNSTAALKFQTCYFIWENKAMREMRPGEGGATTDAPDGTDPDGDEQGAHGDDPSREEEEAEVGLRPRNEISTNMLGAVLMEELGYPLTDFQKALLSLRKDALATSLMGMVDAESWHWVPMDDENPPKPLRTLRDINWLVIDRAIAT